MLAPRLWHYSVARARVNCTRIGRRVADSSVRLNRDGPTIPRTVSAGDFTVHFVIRDNQTGRNGSLIALTVK